MQLVKATKFVFNAQNRLLEQDKQREKTVKLVTSVISEVQEVENAMYDVYTNCGVYTAIGAQLDVVGLLVGEARVGRIDEVYRTAILARIKLNVGGGEPDTIIDAIKQWMNPILINFTEPAPAYFTLFIQSAVNIPNIATIVKEISPAGVGSTVSTLPAGLKPLILSEVKGEPVDFEVQATPIPSALDDYHISVADSLAIEALGIFNFSQGGVLAEVYLTKSILTIEDGGVAYEYDLGNGDELDLKLINSNEDYTVSIFGGKLAEVRI
jgi:hypothetical protein